MSSLYVYPYIAYFVLLDFTSPQKQWFPSQGSSQKTQGKSPQKKKSINKKDKDPLHLFTEERMRHISDESKHVVQCNTQL